MCQRQCLQIARLHGYDSFLQQALSSKGIDVRKREAEALRARIERELAGTGVGCMQNQFISSSPNDPLLWKSQEKEDYFSFVRLVTFSILGSWGLVLGPTAELAHIIEHQHAGEPVPAHIEGCLSTTTCLLLKTSCMFTGVLTL